MHLRPRLPAALLLELIIISVRSVSAAAAPLKKLFELGSHMSEQRAAAQLVGGEEEKNNNLKKKKTHKAVTSYVYSWTFIY